MLAEDGVFVWGRDTRRRPRVVVFANEKGGTGKTTLALHTIIALHKLGYRVASVDMDVRQTSLSLYLQNRVDYGRQVGIALGGPEQHVPLRLSGRASEATSLAGAAARVREAFQVAEDADFLIVDTPGADTLPGRLAVANADVLLTPVNDSLLDLSVVAHLDPARHVARAPSIVTKAVWDQNRMREAVGRAPIDWLLVRNRLAALPSRNTRDIDRLLPRLAERIGFRVATGVSERVVYRELFLRGLTVFDTDVPSAAEHGRESHQRARAEIRQLLVSAGLPSGSTAAEPAGRGLARAV